MFLLLQTSEPIENRQLKATEHDGYYYLYAGNKPLACLKKRDNYPGTYCDEHPAGSFTIGYGPRVPRHNDEFLRVHASKKHGLIVERDVLCTLPVFYGYSQGNLVISNDYAEVCSRMPQLSVNKSAITKLLTPIDEDYPTMWNEIHVLGERERLYYKNGKLTVRKAAPRHWNYATELVPTHARDFHGMIRSWFDEFIETRLRNERVGFEISGGLDSSFLPLYIAKENKGIPMVGVTHIQPGSQSEHQQLKIADLEAYAGMYSHKLPLDHAADYPLSWMIATNQWHPFYNKHDMYEAGTRKFVSFFKDQGVSVVVHGGGGDQLLENRPHPTILKERLLPDRFSPPPFFTFAPPRNPALEVVEHRPTLLAHSVFHENLTGGNAYIENGIWPVSPFYNVDLFNYCQALPVQFRIDKNIYRAYFEAHGYPQSLYRGTNEDFASFYNNALLTDRFDQLISYYAAHSLTRRFGIADPAALLRHYREIRGGAAQTTHLFKIYLWLTAEINLHMLWNKTAA